MSSPKVQEQQPMQEAKQADATELYKARRKASTSNAGTLLTGTSGVAPTSGGTGSTTLLGG